MTEMWVPWSLEGMSEIMVGNVNFNQVFDAIKSQLELLRRQQAKMLELGNAGEVLRKLEYLTEKSEAFDRLMEASSKDKERIAAIEEKQQSMQVEMDSKLEVLAADMRARIMQEVTATESAKRETRLSEVQAAYDEKLEDMGDTLQFFITKHSETHTDLTEYLNGFVENNVSEIKTKLTDLETQVGKLRDLLAVNELRLKVVEGKTDSNIQEVNALRDEVEEIPARFINKIYLLLDQLNRDKATKQEVQLKADLAAVQGKADVEQIDRVAEGMEELDRKTAQHYLENQEGLKAINKRLERKVEKIARWCLQQVRKDLHSNPTDPGTDIGRIHCLVCDQPVHQTNETDVVRSGPGLVASIKQRAKSPSPERIDADREVMILNNTHTGDTTASPISGKFNFNKYAAAQRQKSRPESAGNRHGRGGRDAPHKSASLDHIKMNSAVHMIPRASSSGASKGGVFLSPPNLPAVSNSDVLRKITDSADDFDLPEFKFRVGGDGALVVNSDNLDTTQADALPRIGTKNQLVTQTSSNAHVASSFSPSPTLRNTVEQQPNPLLPEGMASANETRTKLQTKDVDTTALYSTGVVSMFKNEGAGVLSPANISRPPSILAAVGHSANSRPTTAPSKRA